MGFAWLLVFGMGCDLPVRCKRNKKQRKGNSDLLGLSSVLFTFQMTAIGGNSLIFAKKA